MDEIVKKIQNTLNINHDIPTSLLGILNNMMTNEPHNYWSREVMEEVCDGLSKYYEKDANKFLESFFSAQEHFFAAINSYNAVIEIYSELNDISYEEGLKTKIYRNPIYTQICEDCLMNFYRCLRDIINEYSDKNYSKQNTLGAVLPVLQKKFPKVVSIDINIRNAISHGNIASAL